MKSGPGVRCLILRFLSGNSPSRKALEVKSLSLTSGGERKRDRECFLDRVAPDTITAMAKCRDAHVLQPVA